MLRQVRSCNILQFNIATLSRTLSEECYEITGDLLVTYYGMSPSIGAHLTMDSMLLRSLKLDSPFSIKMNEDNVHAWNGTQMGWSWPKI